MLIFFFGKWLRGIWKAWVMEENKEDHTSLAELSDILVEKEGE